MTAYLREKKQALAHLFVVLGIVVSTFVLIGITSQNFGRNLFLLKLLFGGLSLFSLLHYAFIVRFPTALVSIRKFLLVFLDIVTLTLSIIIIGKSGLFLLPLYILIVMESGVNFGLGYFYFSLFVSSLSWLGLIQYSDYWEAHSDTVAIFAITTFLIPLVYLKKMMSLHEKQDKLHETLKSTDHEANYDALTGLPNRKHYESFMKRLLKERDFFALLFIDLNKFKAINDTHGHDVGDAVLIEVAKRLNASLDEGDMLARLGGDEFVIITKRKKVFLAKFLDRLEEITIGNHQVDDVSVLIELSIGVSLFPDDSKSETFLRKYADEAMYVAKKAPNKYHIFYEEIKASLEPSEDSF
ncbi:MAG TPA: GGDEF domain-containing protein [Epsilonproteobacteria bacterium]|nr:GGDEF domain-containing protein [Campylobacterota bacterium]